MSTVDEVIKAGVASAGGPESMRTDSPTEKSDPPPVSGAKEVESDGAATPAPAGKKEVQFAEDTKGGSKVEEEVVEEEGGGDGGEKK